MFTATLLRCRRWIGVLIPDSGFDRQGLQKYREWRVPWGLDLWWLQWGSGSSERWWGPEGPEGLHRR